jgi:hypothetical protein
MMKGTVGTTSAVKFESIVKGSQCMKCIGGLGVWCSRTYAYVSTTAFTQGTLSTYSIATTADAGMALYPNGNASP